MRFSIACIVILAATTAGRGATGGRAVERVCRPRTARQACDGVSRDRSPVRGLCRVRPRSWRRLGHRHRRRARALRARPACATSRRRRRVDADTVFRIASMTKSFTAMSILKLRDERQAVAGRSGRAVRAGAEGPEVPDDRLAADHHPSSAVALRRLPGGQPVGRSAAVATPKPSCRACCAQGIPFSNAPGIAYEYSNYGFAILGRIVSQVSGHAVRRVRDGEHPAAARHDVDDARIRRRCRRIDAGASAIAGRTTQWKEEPALPARLVRLDGRHADVRPRPQPLRRALPRRVAAARRSGDRPDPPVVASRDAAALAPVGDARRAGQVRAERGADVDAATVTASA